MTKVVILDAQNYERLSISCPVPKAIYGTNLHDCGDEWRETMKMKQDRGIVTKGKATYHLERAIFMRFDRVSQVHTFRRFRDGDMR